MSKHTPGPWTTNRPNRWNGVSIRAEGQHKHRSAIANVRAYGVITGEPEESDANARLIAKAPEMYYFVLDQLVEFYDDIYDGPECELPDWLDEAENILADILTTSTNAQTRSETVQAEVWSRIQYLNGREV
jgi:hypothetical protein